MKYAKKMVLTDYDPEKSVNTKNVFEVDTKEDHTLHSKPSEGLNEMLKLILLSKSMNDHDKVKLYSEVLQKYLFARSDDKQQKEKETDSMIDKLLERINKKQYPKLLSTFQDDGSNQGEQSVEKIDQNNVRFDDNLSENSLDTTPTEISRKGLEFLNHSHMRLTGERVPNSGEKIYRNLRSGKKYIKRRLNYEEYTPAKSSRKSNKIVKNSKSESNTPLVSPSVIKLWEKFPMKKRRP
jgi:hypothetical protein